MVILKKNQFSKIKQQKNKKNKKQHILFFLYQISKRS